MTDQPNMNPQQAADLLARLDALTPDELDRAVAICRGWTQQEMPGYGSPPTWPAWVPPGGKVGRLTPPAYSADPAALSLLAEMRNPHLWRSTHGGWHCHADVYADEPAIFGETAPLAIVRSYLRWKLMEATRAQP